REIPDIGLDTDEDDAHQHGQTAQGGDHEGLPGGATGGGTLTVVADQQEGQDRGDLPEHVHQEDVVGDDQAVHGHGETDELTTEGAQAARVGVEIPPAVEQNQ